MFPRPARSRAIVARDRIAIFVPALVLALVACALAAVPARAQDGALRDPDFQATLSLPPAAASSLAHTANSNCAGATCDTVWVGHLGTGPGGSFLGVGVGGVWDFDTDVAGTDSSQGWQRYAYPVAFGGNLPLLSRTWQFYDYGNMINEGNSNLWHARDLAGRHYVRHGCVGAWHADDMAGVKKKLNDATEPSAVPIAGARSAWCGLRASGDLHAIDALTGCGINGDLIHNYGAPSSTNPDFPGYCSLWDQMMYKDFPSTGTGTVHLRARTDLISFVDNSFVTGSAWFNPDPTNVANIVQNPSDSFMVYVGSPNENAFDTNRRWFSEVLDFTQPVQELFHYGNKMPVSGPADTTLDLGYSGIHPVAGNVRVVFRVKTNRVRSDQSTDIATGPNTKDGAAVIDEVSVDGGQVYGFDAVGDVVARELIPDLAAPGGAWATTGRPAASYWHIENLSQLIYEDLCGQVGSPTRECNMAGNVAVAGSFDLGDKIPIESFEGFESPTIDLAVRTAPPGTKNAQGIDHETATRTKAVVSWDFYPGFMGLDQSVFFYYGGRFYGPTSVEPVSGVPCWSPTQFNGFIQYDPYRRCQTAQEMFDDDLYMIPAGQIDSLRLKIASITQGYRFGGNDQGDTRGTYWDNLRVGFVRTSAAPALTQGIYDKYQDQFPVNEAVTPGDNGAFDTTTSYVKSARNISTPINGPGLIAGDSMLAIAAWSGNGVTTGTRVDLVFRIDPGPGNYTTKGLRSSALVEKDPAHPFWAAYMADNGAFGTGGNGVSGPGHGATWDRNLWNSCRMDSAQRNLWPIQSRSLGGPVADTWMSTIHEQDPKFAALGIVRNVCFLTNPAGNDDATNTTCTGTAPAAYATAAGGGPPAGTTLEGTKIIPDGYLSPGAHVEYFLRRSSLEDPNTATLVFDTTKVYPQDAGANTNLDAERWSSFDVLPDLWKSSRFGGHGLACLLMVDGDDRRGADVAYRGTADSLGYGKLDGATQGWHVVDAAPTDPSLTTGRGPNNPAGFVAANLGQYGDTYDHYDIEGVEGLQCGHPGARLATPQSGLAARADKSGPSLAQLATFYSTVLHLTGDVSYGTLTDGVQSQEQANDVTLYSNYLAGASSGNARGVWLAGDNIMEEAFGSNSPNLYTFLNNTFGADVSSTNVDDGDYKLHGAVTAREVGFLPNAPWNHPGRIYGIDVDCAGSLDFFKVVATAADAAEAAEYQAGTGTGPWLSSIYRPTSPGVREFRTLLDGFDLSHLRGNYATLGAVGSAPESDTGRFGWFGDVAAGGFAVCLRNPPSEGIGDLPGHGAAGFVNANLGAFPNPSLAARPVTLRFSLAHAGAVSIRIYSVAGREVARLAHAAAAGANTVVWDGRAANGARVAPGVYFYRIAGEGLPAGALAPSRMVLLSAR